MKSQYSVGIGTYVSYLFYVLLYCIIFFFGDK